MTNYPGEPPHPSDGEPSTGQPAGAPQDGPTTGPAPGPPDDQSDTELTQPVGYWEQQARAQQGGPQGSQHEAQPWARRPDPTTAYPSQPANQPYSQPPPSYQQPYQQPQQYGGPYDQPYAQAPSYPPGYPPYGAFAPPRPDHPQSTLSMILGLVGLVGALMFCGLPLVVSPFAWALGRNALKDIKASQGRVGGESQARAGMIMGIVGTVLAVLALVGILVIIVVAIASSDTTSGSSI
jgi:hypothetical protein